MKNQTQAKGKPPHEVSCGLLSRSVPVKNKPRDHQLQRHASQSQQLRAQLGLNPPRVRKYMTNAMRRAATACSGATAVQASHIADACHRRLTSSDAVSLSNNSRPRSPAGIFMTRVIQDATKRWVQWPRGFRREDPCANRGRSFRRHRRGCGEHQTRTQPCRAGKSKRSKRRLKRWHRA